MNTASITKRYFGIEDHATGYIFGVVKATDPEAACRALDADLGASGRYYETVQDIGPGESGYHVYELPPDFPAVTDGRDSATIARVLGCRFVASVRTAAT